MYFGGSKPPPYGIVGSCTESGEPSGVTIIAGVTVPKMEAGPARRPFRLEIGVGLADRSLPGAVLSCFGKKVPKEADSRGKVKLPLDTRTP